MDEGRFPLQRCHQQSLVLLSGKIQLFPQASVLIYPIISSGGSIGGLALAVALSKYPDIRVDVYEAAKEFEEIGAGIMMWERTWRILQTLGLDEDLSKAANSPPNGLPGSYLSAISGNPINVNSEP